MEEPHVKRILCKEETSSVPVKETVLLLFDGANFGSSFSRSCALKTMGPTRNRPTSMQYLAKLQNDVSTQIGLFRAILDYQEWNKVSPLGNKTGLHDFVTNWLQVYVRIDEFLHTIARLSGKYASIHETWWRLECPLKREAFCLANRVWNFFGPFGEGTSFTREHMGHDDELRTRELVVAKEDKGKEPVGCGTSESKRLMITRKTTPSVVRECLDNDDDHQVTERVVAKGDEGKEPMGRETAEFNRLVITVKAASRIAREGMDNDDDGQVTEHVVVEGDKENEPIGCEREVFKRPAITKKTALNILTMIRDYRIFRNVDPLIDKEALEELVSFLEIEVPVDERIEMIHNLVDDYHLVKSGIYFGQSVLDDVLVSRLADFVLGQQVHDFHHTNTARVILSAAIAFKQMTGIDPIHKTAFLSEMIGEFDLRIPLEVCEDIVALLEDEYDNMTHGRLSNNPMTSDPMVHDLLWELRKGSGTGVEGSGTCDEELGNRDHGEVDQPKNMKTY